MSSDQSDPKDSITSVAEASFVRERAPDIERGTVLAGRYQIEEILGRGGSGIVLRAFDRTAQTVVALKVLKSELASDAKWSRRFSRELRLGRPIQHPNVCRIFDIGEADGHRFLTMELASGGTLRDQLKRGASASRPLAERRADAEAVIAGLAAIHAVGIVHRDFKPDNLLRMEDGRLVLSDFGLATDSANAPGVTVLIGTPHYMAPEVLAGEPATTRSDVWALGVVLHEIFFGRRPERRSTSFDGSTKPPARPASADERAMADLCERCLAEAPLDRPADAGAVLRLFRLPRSAAPLRRRRSTRYVIGAGLGAVALLLAGGVALRRHRRAGTPSAPPTTSDVIRLEPTGEAADWSKVATLVTEVPGRVHCFSMVDDETARLVWGTPRRAEDVDIASGRRSPSPLAPETYAVGCPDLSPGGNALLFASLNAAGTSEIRISRADGREAKVTTSGSDPMWLRNGEGFLYDLDSTHPALFALPTMNLTLLPDSHPGEHQAIVQKAVHPTRDAAAVMFFVDNFELAVAIYEGRSLDYRRTFVIPAGRRIQFDDRNDDVLISYGVAGSGSILAVLDWRRGDFRNFGRYPGFDLVAARDRGQRPIVLGRHISADIWAYDRSGGHPLTSDGETYSAAIFPAGDLLLSKRGDGKTAIWSQRRNGALERLTAGPADVEPDISRDGRWWVYSDYAQKSIMLCSTAGESCRALRRDELWPSWPKFSPDGSRVAYVTLTSAPRLTILSVADGLVQQSWDAYPQCPPVWSSATTLWSLEVSAGRYAWAERNTITGERTGNRVNVADSEVALSEASCWPADVGPDSPFFRRVRVETKETTRLLSLPAQAWKR